jgi:hypothetical protein
MKNRLQQPVTSGSVAPTKPFIEIVDPDVGKLNGVIEAFQTGRAHGAPPKALALHLKITPSIIALSHIKPATSFSATLLQLFTPGSRQNTAQAVSSIDENAPYETVEGAPHWRSPDWLRQLARLLRGSDVDLSQLASRKKGYR